MGGKALVVGSLATGMERVSGCLGLRGFELVKVDGSVNGDRLKALSGDLSVAVFLSDVELDDVARCSAVLREKNDVLKVVWEGVEEKGAIGGIGLVSSGLVDFCGGYPLDLVGLTVVVEKSLLLVDDNVAFVMPMALLLRGSGFNVVDALSMGDGLSAVDKYGRFFDVALVDYDLDGEFSTDLVRQLRYVNPECFIVMMTGGHYADMGFDDLISEGAINTFIKKPFMVRDYLDTLRKAAGMS